MDIKGEEMIAHCSNWRHIENIPGVMLTTLQDHIFSKDVNYIYFS
jgi:hypothetical protein